ncbi:MAG: hypothetical protein BIFFINMI_02778 [Phycisphaerae bacterium]|nr:hypothetical protein [Phycisphaerae bacterium]
MTRRLLTVGLLVAIWACPAMAGVPAVHAPRPRIWLRDQAWSGPTWASIKANLDRPDYKARLPRLGATPIGKAMLYKLTGDRAAGEAAVAWMTRVKFQNDDSPSYTGIEAERLAAMHDWLHDDAIYPEAARKKVVALLEEQGDYYVKYLGKGGPTPFYSRIPGAVAGLTLIGLTLSGDSPKADGFIAFARDFLVNDYGTIRQMEDGAACGGGYSFHHMFTDCANLVAAWRSATDWDAADWIVTNQGDWLRRQMMFHIWSSNPKGWLYKDGDIWGAKASDKTQFLMHIATISGIYRDGFGRSYLDLSAKRWGTGDFHPEYLWEWFLFNDPTIPAKPLSDLGRMAVFSPKLHGIVTMRSGWDDDATVIHFSCGETVNHHATWDQGKFTIFKHEPLAIKNGGYLGGYMGLMHLYYKSPWSANCMVLTGSKAFGWQPRIDFDGFQSWTAWKAERDRRYKRPPTGVLLASESNDDYARVLGDMTGAWPEGTSWTREMVFLGYKYLLVLDRVKAPAEFQSQWLLHSVKPPTLAGDLVRIDNGQGRLFSRTLLPADAKVIDRSGKGNEYRHVDSKGVDRTIATADGHHDKFNPAKTPAEFQLGEGRVDVQAPAGDAIYLHVVYPADAGVDTMPATSVRQAADAITVTVGDLSYTFKFKAQPAAADH